MGSAQFGLLAAAAAAKQPSSSVAHPPTHSRDSGCTIPARHGQSDSNDNNGLPLRHGRSQWDRLPVELHLMILASVSPLTRFVCSRPSERERLDAAAIRAVWLDALAMDWSGDLHQLPYVELLQDDMTLVRSRSMYHRLCDRFPRINNRFRDRAINKAINEYSTNRVSVSLDNQLCQVPMRHCWFDLLDMEYPIALGWHAILGGHAALLKHLAAKRRIRLRSYSTMRGTRAMDLAAQRGHVEIVQTMHAARCPYYSHLMMNGAAERGRLDMLVWLHQRGYECTARAMDLAAENGHFEVVQWLHANRTEGFNDYGAERAIRNGHGYIIDWLNANPRG